MQVYKKILVPIDCSPVDHAIIEHVKALAIQNGAKVHLLHVVHSHSLDQERVLHKETEATLKSYREALQALDIETRTVIRSGEPDEEILAEVAGEDYDLVAMATHGHRFIGDMLFGSVSTALKHRINIPLLLLRAER